MAGHRIYGALYDASLYRLHGLDPVHAETGAVPAALPLHGLLFRGLLFLRRPGAGHDAERIPVHDDDFKERHPEHSRKPGGERSRVRRGLRAAASENLRTAAHRKLRHRGSAGVRKDPFRVRHPLHPGTPHRLLRIYHRHSPVFHHGPGGFRKIRQPVLGADLYLHGSVDAAELYYE